MSPVRGSFARRTTYLCDVRGILFSRPQKAPPQAPEHKTTSTQDHRTPHFCLIPRTPSLCAVTVFNYPVPTNVKEVCVSPFCFLSNPSDFSALLSPAPLIYHQWISYRTPLMSSPLILMYKISCKTAILQSIFLKFEVWFWACPQNLGSNKLLQKYFCRLDVLLWTRSEPNQKSTTIDFSSWHIWFFSLPMSSYVYVTIALYFFLFV